MKLSPNFYRDEFACKCGCGFDTVDAELLEILELARGSFQRPIVINSGCRCQEYNKSVAGTKNSQHLLGRAADIVVNGILPSRVAEWGELLLETHGGIGRYKTFTHIDTRSGKQARWEQL